MFMDPLTLKTFGAHWTAIASARKLDGMMQTFLLENMLEGSVLQLQLSVSLHIINPC